jgi:hypothetical protein
MCEVTNILHSPHSFDIYIGYTMSGSPVKWGNQFDVAGDLYLPTRDRIPNESGKLDIDHAVDLYRIWLLYTRGGRSLQEDIDELRGKVLGCFCKPHPCHGDVLVELLGQREEME